MGGGLKIIIFLGIIMFLITPFISAGFTDWLQKTITGKASSKTTNITVEISGANPVVIEKISLDPTNSFTVVEGSIQSIVFYVLVYDPDGVNDINDSGTKGNLSRDGEPTGIRTNSSCLNLTDVNSTHANFSCTVDLFYWDVNGEWNTSASANDLGDKTIIHNISGNNISYDLGKHMVMWPRALSWGSVAAGATNETADNDPTYINNTGNYNSTIDVTAIDIGGTTIQTEYIYAENFTTGLTTGNGCAGAACTECAGTRLVNETSTTITGSSANRGNLTDFGSNSGQELFYWCIHQIATILSSQPYSTNNTGAWTVEYP